MSQDLGEHGLLGTGVGVGGGRCPCRVRRHQNPWLIIVTTQESLAVLAVVRGFDGRGRYKDRLRIGGRVGVLPQLLFWQSSFLRGDEPGRRGRSLRGESGRKVRGILQLWVAIWPLLHLWQTSNQIASLFIGVSQNKDRLMITQKVQLICLIVHYMSRVTSSDTIRKYKQNRFQFYYQPITPI